MFSYDKIAYAVALLSVITLLYFGYRWRTTKKEHFNESKHTLLFFYADWCPHCTNFKPEVIKFKKQNEGNKQLDVEMLEESTCPPELMKKHNVRGFPTVVLVTKDSSGNETAARTYQGERTSDGLQHFVDTMGH